nr:uncharacterized protein LOC128685454 [Cherax quadricarinatus]
MCVFVQCLCYVVHCSGVCVHVFLFIVHTVFFISQRRQVYQCGREDSTSGRRYSGIYNRAPAEEEADGGGGVPLTPGAHEVREHGHPGQAGELQLLPYGSEMNVFPVDGLDTRLDPTRLLSVHCLLFPNFSYCAT